MSGGQTTEWVGDILWQGRLSKASVEEDLAPASMLHLHADLSEKGPCLG